MTDSLPVTGHPPTPHPYLPYVGCQEVPWGVTPVDHPTRLLVPAKGNLFPLLCVERWPRPIPLSHPPLHQAPFGLRDPSRPITHLLSPSQAIPSCTTIPIPIQCLTLGLGTRPTCHLQGLGLP